MVRASRRFGLACLLVCCCLSALWGYLLQRNSPDGMLDFKGAYYAARSVFQHHDPYKVGEPLRVCQSEGGDCAEPSDVLRQVLSLIVYFPTVFIFTVPFATQPWGIVHLFWMALGAGILCLAAFLMWDMARDLLPVASLALICFLLANCEAIFGTGNIAGIVVGLCVVAVWCILRGRYVPAGIFCMALSLLIKPHDAGPVWLCLLLAGGVYRKRALQTLVLAAVLGLPSVLWVSHIAPNWIGELHSNFLTDSAPGGACDPGPSTPNSGDGPSVNISLQSNIALVWHDPRIYNLATYLICGLLLLIWMILVLRSRLSQSSVWIAFGSVVPLSMLVTYHRPYDAKLLLLAVPACALLWAESRSVGWMALLVTSAGIASTADIPLTGLLILNQILSFNSAGLLGKIVAAILMRPTPLILFAMAIFFLWALSRRTEQDRRTPLVACGAVG